MVVVMAMVVVVVEVAAVLLGNSTLNHPPPSSDAMYANSPFATPTEYSSHWSSVLPKNRHLQEVSLPNGLL